MKHAKNTLCFDILRKKFKWIHHKKYKRITDIASEKFDIRNQNRIKIWYKIKNESL
jgi:hypothetical protein